MKTRHGLAHLGHEHPMENSDAGATKRVMLRETNQEHPAQNTGCELKLVAAVRCRRATRLPIDGSEGGPCAFEETGSLGSQIAA